MKTFRKGGIHPPQCKLTASSPIIELELPRSVTLSFAQHIGAMGECVVSKGDSVHRGDLIIKAGGFVSANVHTPISGKVVAIDKCKNAFGFPVDTVTINANENEHHSDLETICAHRLLRTDEDLLQLSPDEIKNIIADAGIVGLGGATFPTRVKLTPPEGSHPNLVIINGVECEPYLTCDHALMLSEPEGVVRGALLTMHAANVSKCVIAVEDNKRDAIYSLRRAAREYHEIEIIPLRVKYPQGGEKQLVEAITGCEIPSGALPVAVGAIVQNVATAYAIYRAVAFGEPLMERIVTVTGPRVAKAGNFKVAIGTPIRSLIEAAGGIPMDTGKVILGGPMMGRTTVALDAPTVKGISGIVLLPESEALRKVAQACVRCGACVEACPMGLEPLMIATYSRLSRLEDAEKMGIADCIECGCCSYSCPAARPLLDYIRVGKQSVLMSRRTRTKK